MQGCGADAAVLAVLDESPVPLHYSEIANLVSKRSNKAIDQLNPKIQENLSRFKSRLSVANRKNVTVTKNANGTYTFNSTVPGKVPGSKAVYSKTVDSKGTTISVTKSTFDPKGNIVHVKDKL